VNVEQSRDKLALMQKLGVPYTNEQIDAAAQDYEAQARAIEADLASQGAKVAWDSEMVAMIGYMQRLGRTPSSRAGTAPVAQGSGLPPIQEGR
jgi:cytochrome c oxidase cbb3-type subunit I/II